MESSSARDWLLLIVYYVLAVVAQAGFAADQQSAFRLASPAGDILARHIEDRDHISIIELSGNYDRYLSAGAFNQHPRELVAKEFLNYHNDQYDFLIVFSRFDFDPGEDASAFYVGVQNQVEGIGRLIFDNTAAFGSNGKLQGYIDMGAMSQYAMDPLQPRFESLLALLNHEILHQWAAYVHFLDDNGRPSDALIGHQGTHWSFLLDSDASVMYGNDWHDNANGSFTSAAAQTFFSPLDLYL